MDDNSTSVTTTAAVYTVDGDQDRPRSQLDNGTTTNTTIDDGGDAIPVSVIDNLVDFHEKITKLEEAYKPILAQTLGILQADKTALEKAKLDLLTLYAVNSAFWSFLCTKGIEPKENEVLVHELERARNFMEKIRMLEAKSKAPKLDKRVVQNFVRNALFDPTIAAKVEQHDKKSLKQTDGAENLKKRKKEKFATTEKKHTKKKKVN